VKKFIENCVVRLFWLILWFRYRVKIKGLDTLTPEVLNKSGGILFLPNHPAAFVDPIVVSLAVWPRFPIRPMIVEYMYYLPGVHMLMRYLDALPIPNFEHSSNSLKKKKGDAVIQQMVQSLAKGQNFLIYPAGKLKVSSKEVVGGASAVHKVLQDVPQANVVLVRIKGLWGSSFSKAATGKTPPLFPTLWEGMKSCFKNLLFFTPRRNLEVEFVPAPEDFPYQASRLEMNRYLENWYNQPDGLMPQKGDEPGDSLMLVSYSMWGEKYLELKPREVEKGLDEIVIPEEVQEKVIEKISAMTEMPPASITPDMNLSTDVGLDSLDIAELVAFLQEQFEVKRVPVSALTSVKKLMAIASKQIVCPEDAEETVHHMSYWNWKRKHVLATIPEGKTIHETFLNNCARMGKQVACGDARSGVLTYPEMKLRVILLAEYIRRLPGQYIGIMLPASVGATVCILACQLAGKVPLLINWTIGPKHLESVVKFSNIQVVLSSWAFIDRLEGVDFNGIEDMFIMLEDAARGFGMKEKLQALIRSKRGTKALLRIFNVEHLDGDSKAVLLFTSGTESLPKGVPLSHHNVLINQRDIFASLHLYEDDILLGILPPFHAFGFTISSLLGLVGGIRVVYSPDPTDGKKLANAMETWKVTIMCGAPTFLKAAFKAATPEQAKTMRLCGTGAEKAPPELFELVKNLGKEGTVIEGYGITECAPVLTFNQLGRPQRGVGQPVSHVELCIIHPETQQVLPQGEQGMILARGENVFAGYLNPSIAPPFVEVNGHHWYKTGDLGYLDEEGNLIISGRLKRFIKVGGEMISLASIEDALLHAASSNNWPTPDEGPTLAICAKEREGEKPRIFLFTRFPVAVEEVNRTLKNSGLSNLARVTAAVQLEDIPIMGTGKINYRFLESQYLD